ncbi:putative permease [Archaeoglobus sulfaticallidus PM70-1]|uniref:Probable membrane transporter protein n=1 Tax=Archaeoglobus sulfaticallidus PM70-1 TaxID=387631 RepID=N0BEN3_9EURY|nr:sulfite exporter TauE/SafE family protein [Archaeoglobus sulfaticallidus]AGK62084.1 putative permease [Archaeoglobus sulfaticallidus PM70-1]
MVTELKSAKKSRQTVLAAISAIILIAGILAWFFLQGGAMGVSLWSEWVIFLFLFTFVIGILGPMSGVGGGVIFVGLGMAILPFHVDFIRGAGLVAALTTALSSAPHFTKKGLANFKVAAPLVVVSTIFSIMGSVFGLWISNAFPQGSSYVKVSLGVVLFIMLAALATSKNVEYPETKKQDRLSKMLNIYGEWYEPTLNRVVEYRVGNLPIGLLFFAGVGFVAGMFGLGAGWANVPVLNLIMGVPLKAAVATSMVILAINDSASLWVYLSKGAVLPLIVVPTVLGIGIGSRIGSRIAVRTKPKVIKYLVIGLIGLSAIVNIIQGLSSMGVFKW